VFDVRSVDVVIPTAKMAIIDNVLAVIFILPSYERNPYTRLV